MREDPATPRLEEEISSALEEHFFDGIAGIRGMRCDGEVYETEETDEPFDPIVLVRDGDGARFQVQIDVWVSTLPPKPPEPEADPDAPVHIEGQEEIPLGIAVPS